MRQIRRMTGTSRRNNRMNPVVIAVIAGLVVVYALLWVQLAMLVVLFVASVIGIVVAAVIRKYEPTEEDKLYESTIKNFQVPNTKEALFEFAIMATPKVRPVSKLASMFNIEAKRQLWMNRVWLDKCEGVYTRATLAMKDDRTSFEEMTRVMRKIGLKI